MFSKGCQNKYFEDYTRGHCSIARANDNNYVGYRPPSIPQSCCAGALWVSGSRLRTSTFVLMLKDCKYSLGLIRCGLHSALRRVMTIGSCIVFGSQLLSSSVRICNTMISDTPGIHLQLQITRYVIRRCEVDSPRIILYCSIRQLAVDPIQPKHSWEGFTQ